MNKAELKRVILGQLGKSKVVLDEAYVIKVVTQAAREALDIDKSLREYMKDHPIDKRDYDLD